MGYNFLTQTWEWESQRWGGCPGNKGAGDRVAVWHQPSTAGRRWRELGRLRGEVFPREASCRISSQSQSVKNSKLSSFFAAKLAGTTEQVAEHNCHPLRVESTVHKSPRAAAGSSAWQPSPARHASPWEGVRSPAA